MHRLQQKIIDVFTQDADARKTTSQLVQAAFPDAMVHIAHALEHGDTKQQKIAHRNKAQLHRKLLYHVNKLVDQQILDTVGIHDRGEKEYALIKQQGHIIVQSKSRTITIPTAEKPNRFVEKWEHEGFLFALTNKLHKIEAYAINAQNTSGIHHIRRLLAHVANHVEDALCVLHAEELFSQETHALEEGLAQLIADSKDHNIAITFHVDLSARIFTLQDAELLRILARYRPRRLYVVFSGTTKHLKEQRVFLNEAAQLLCTQQLKLNVQNASVYELPVFMGRAGMYKLCQDQLNILSHQEGTIIATGSYVLDFGKLQLPPHEVRTIATDITKTLLAHAAFMRRKASQQLSGLLCCGALSKQTATPRAYIRIWNYDWQQEGQPAIIQSLAQHVHAVVELHNQIFANSGVPIAFDVLLSSAFAHYGKLTSRLYIKRSVYSRESFSDEQFTRRERLAQIYDCDRLRIFREGNFSAQDLVSEIRHLMNTYSFGYITYDFKELQKTMSLTQFT